jgi:hypothetical protein
VTAVALFVALVWLDVVGPREGLHCSWREDAGILAGSSQFVRPAAGVFGVAESIKNPQKG